MNVVDLAKVDILKTLHDDHLKLTELRKLRTSDATKATIIQTLHDDTLKRMELRKLSIRDAMKIDVIKTFQDDTIKLAELQQLVLTDLKKSEVLRTLQDDTIKINELEKLSNEHAKMEVIETLQDISLRITELNKLKNVTDYQKTKILYSIEDDTSKIDALLKVSLGNFVKASVIKTLHSDKKKIEALELLPDDFAKIIVIESLEDDEIKLQQIQELHNPLAKAILIEKYQMQVHMLLPETPFHDRDKLKELVIGKHLHVLPIDLDKKLTFGIEIECEGDLNESLHDLRELLKSPTETQTRSWKMKYDRTLLNGLEVASPILTDTRKDIEELYIICALLQKCNLTTSYRCGAHIHIGADYLTSTQAYINLMEIWCNAEKILYLISNEKGHIPRIKFLEAASPISEKVSNAIKKGTIKSENGEELDTFVTQIRQTQGHKCASLNFITESTDHKTIEFRTANGTLQPTTWIENARLFGRIVEISQKLAEWERQPVVSPKAKKQLALKNRLKQNLSEQEKLETLLDLLFSEEEKNVYRDRYITNSKLLEQIPEETHPFQKMKFCQVDFGKKHQLNEFKEIAQESRNSTIQAITAETIRAISEKTAQQGISNETLESGQR